MLFDLTKLRPVDDLRLTIRDWEPTHHARIYFRPLRVMRGTFESPALVHSEGDYWLALRRVNEAINHEVFGAQFADEGYEVAAAWSVNRYAPDGEFEGQVLLKSPTWKSPTDFSALVARAWAAERTYAKLTYIEPWSETEFETRVAEHWALRKAGSRNVSLIDQSLPTPK